MQKNAKTSIQFDKFLLDDLNIIKIKTGAKNFSQLIQYFIETYKGKLS